MTDPQKYSDRDISPIEWPESLPASPYTAINSSVPDMPSKDGNPDLVRYSLSKEENTNASQLKVKSDPQPGQVVSLSPQDASFLTQGTTPLLFFFYQESLG